MTDIRITEPIALARKARHRKPNRRRNVIKATLGSLASVAAIGGTMAFASAQPGAQTFYGLTATQAQTVAAAVTCHSPAGKPGEWRSAYADGPVFVCDAYGSWVHVQDLSSTTARQPGRQEVELDKTAKTSSEEE